MPSDVTLKTMNAAHRVLLALSRGRLGWTAGKMPVLELTTTGRKTGRRHTVLLTSPMRDGDALVVVASRGGDDRSPAWFVNLVAHPEVDVSLQGKDSVPMLARVATAQERARLWPLVIAGHQYYADYQLKTDRQIPLVMLEPIG